MELDNQKFEVVVVEKVGQIERMTCYSTYEIYQKDSSSMCEEPTTSTEVLIECETTDKGAKQYERN